MLSLALVLGVQVRDLLHHPRAHESHGKSHCKIASLEQLLK